MNYSKQGKGVVVSVVLTALLSASHVQAQQTSGQSPKGKTIFTEKKTSIDEDQVRQLTEDFAKAFRDKDVDLMMSLFAPGLVAFDIVPPLQDAGKDTYREVWVKTFAFFRNPIEFETRDLHITAGTDVAFSYELLRLKTNLSNGQKVDRWQRMTFCFHKIDGKWLITHEHVSVPVDFASGKAVLDLVP
jgi:ketosteroid isomerase-like protein